MATFQFVMTVECDTELHALEVAAARLGYDEDYGFEYKLAWEPMRPKEFRCPFGCGFEADGRDDMNVHLDTGCAGWPASAGSHG